jgi:hypothetical protein
MDIAGFVGFAARGPLHVPVPIEDAARFADVFGPPLELVRDPDTGAMITSHLAAAVAAFFRMGGRRCWVVRVAEAPAQRWFVVPGMVDARTGRPAIARARSRGSGFDDLRVGTVLRRRTVPGATLRRDADRWSLHWTARPDGVESGTLLRITRPEAGAWAGIELFAAVDTVGAETNQEGGVVATTSFVGAYRVNPGVPLLPPGGVPATIQGVDGRAALPAIVEGATAPASYSATLVLTPRGLQVRCEDALAPMPSPGHTLIASLADGRTAWLQVEVARRVGNPSAPTGRSVHIEVRTHRWPVEPNSVVPDGARLSSGLVVERVTCDLLAWQGEDVDARLTELDLTARAARSWMRLPTDDALFQLVDGLIDAPASGSLAAEVFDPRFPIAGPVEAPETVGPPPVFIPFGMAGRPDPAAARGPVPDARSTLRRDGLDTFSNALFLDPDVADATTASLGPRLGNKLYLQPNRSTRGVHALWPVREVTLLALPDAVHRGWKQQAASGPPAGLDAPRGLTVAPCANDPSLLCIDWEPVTAPDGSPPQPVDYELQESASPTFEPSTTRYEGPDVHVERPITETCPRHLYVRVRARAGGLYSPWSSTAGAVVPETAFRTQRARVDAPTLRRDPSSAPDGFVLRWQRISHDPFSGASPPAESTVVYDLERARDPGFTRAERVTAVRVVGADTLEHVPVPGVQHTFFRVRARVASEDRPGPWSNTVAVPPEADPPVAPITPQQYNQPASDTPNRGRAGLLDLQRAVLRFCAARGDVLAALALPADDRLRAAQQHLAQLTQLSETSRTASKGVGTQEALYVPTWRTDEVRTLSFGALYHPWTVEAAAESGRTTVRPPDGIACGMAAARSLQQGAWRAPANMPLNGVLGLRPALSDAAVEALLRARANMLDRAPRGAVVLTARTLAPDAALQPIGTRRLLILLRRLAERVGPSLVFESNRPALRRQAAAVFERVLSDLYRRGALAGTTAREAYRVVANASVNPPERVERGQLVVEVRVAPARPLEFITIRLVQRGEQAFTVHEG